MCTHVGSAESTSAAATSLIDVGGLTNSLLSNYPRTTAVIVVACAKGELGLDG